MALCRCVLVLHLVMVGSPCLWGQAQCLKARSGVSPVHSPGGCWFPTLLHGSLAAALSELPQLNCSALLCLSCGCNKLASSAAVMGFIAAVGDLSALFLIPSKLCAVSRLPLETYLQSCCVAGLVRMVLLTLHGACCRPVQPVPAPAIPGRACQASMLPAHPPVCCPFWARSVLYSRQAYRRRVERIPLVDSPL